MTKRTMVAMAAAALLAGLPAARASASDNHQGLWWASPAAAESGWGINFAHQGEVIFATWFTYDATGKGWWLFMIATREAEGRFAGQIYETRGPAFDSMPFNPAAVSVNPVGSGALRFAPDGSAAFDYTVKGVTQTKPLTRQVFGPVPTCTFGLQPDTRLATNFQDLWYASPAESESGWGINLAHQGEVLFATWFTYEPGGAPMWLFGDVRRGAPGRYTGSLYRATGPAFSAVPFLPAQVQVSPVGDLTLEFTDGNRAMMRYTVGATVQAKTITRQTFRPPGTTCQYAEGIWRGSVDSGEAAVAVVLEGGEAYLYWGPPGGSGGHVVRGTLSMDGGAMSADATDYPIAAAGETNDRTTAVRLTGSYLPGGAFAAELTGNRFARSLSAAFEAGGRSRADLAEVAGSYGGISGHVNGRRSVTFSVDAAGVLTGSNNAPCGFRGQLAPRPTVRAFDLTLEPVSGSCIFPRTSGIAYYDAPSRELRLMAPYEAGADLYYVVGTRR
jgi:hypothetical protein